MGKLIRQKRTRKNINKEHKFPRVSVFRSNKYISAQIIDDKKNLTIVSLSDKKIGENKMSKSEKAKKLGAMLAAAAIKKNIKKVVLDRGPYAYHGRVKQIAEGLREGGLEL